MVDGLAGGGADFAKGLWGMGTGLYNSSIRGIYDQQGFDQQWSANAALGSFVWNHPGEFGSGVYHGFVDPYAEAIRSGHPGKAFGRGIFDIASIVVGTKGLDKLSKLSKVGEAASVVATPTGRVYSVAYEMTLDTIDFGKSRSVQFNRANAALDAALQSDPAFARAMEDLIPAGCE